MSLGIILDLIVALWAVGFVSALLCVASEAGVRALEGHPYTYSEIFGAFIRAPFCWPSMLIAYGAYRFLRTAEKFGLRQIDASIPEPIPLDQLPPDEQEEFIKALPLEVQEKVREQLKKKGP